MKKLPINSDKLRKEISKRGLSTSEVSREIGHYSGYISDCINKSQAINEATAKMLQVLFNLPYEAYKADEPETATAIVPEIREVRSFDYDRLGEVIETAVYKAMSKALKGE